MSVYRCGICEETKDADMHGCNEHPKDEFSCICDDCHMYSNPEFACFRCNVADRETHYCKITDQYFHEVCV